MIEPDPCGNLALAKARVGLPRHRGLDAVVGRRRGYGQPIRDPIFDISAKFELLIVRNWNKVAMPVERARGVGESGIGDDLSIPRRQQPGAGSSSLEACAGEPGRGGKQREYKAPTQVTQRNAPSHGARGDNY